VQRWDTVELSPRPGRASRSTGAVVNVTRLAWAATRVTLSTGAVVNVTQLASVATRVTFSTADREPGNGCEVGRLGEAGRLGEMGA
jgi:hypothetical protein